MYLQALTRVLQACKVCRVFEYLIPKLSVERKVTDILEAV